jgi:hypothetical protein
MLAMATMIALMALIAKIGFWLPGFGSPGK